MTQLPIRSPVYIVPPYSLTGDILSYRHCGLQYRYLNGSALPPSRPVQMWFGEFIHLVMEMAIRRYQEGLQGPLPWSDAEIDNICGTIMSRLANEGKTPRSRRVEDMARQRVKVSINSLGPMLFPLVADSEVSLSGTRMMPESSRHRAEYYEVTGRIDVISTVQVNAVPSGTNQLADAIHEFLPDIVTDPFEVIVDYKGMRRPPINSEAWQLYEWQLQTYAWIREKQPGSLPIGAGLIIFMNELLPSKSDIRKLREDMANNSTDVRPANNSPDLNIVLRGPTGDTPFGLSWPFRLCRSLHLVGVQQRDQIVALDRFDRIVSEIEDSVSAELLSGSIGRSWPTNPVRETCVACDFRGICSTSPYRGPAVAPLGRPVTAVEYDEQEE